MLNPNVTAPATHSFPAVVEVFPGHDPDHGVRCRLYHRESWHQAWTWLPIDCDGRDSLPTGFVTTLEVGRGSDELVLLNLNEGKRPLISQLLPADLCPIPGLVHQTTRLIDSLTIPPLRRFVSRSLLQADALHGYWKSPASWRDHHAYDGGLAKHSLEVAIMVASADRLLLEDQELGIAFALLHDYGKIWCYDPLVPEPVDSRKHELIGLTKLGSSLQLLCQEDQVLGEQMRELLGGPRAARASRYPLAIGRIVRSFDQMSCEKTRKVMELNRSISFPDIPI